MRNLETKDLERHSLGSKNTTKLCKILRNADIRHLTAVPCQGEEFGNSWDIKSISYQTPKNIKIDLRRDFISHRWGDIYKYTLTLSQANLLYEENSMNGGIHGCADPSYLHLCLAYTFRHLEGKITRPLKKEYRKKMDSLHKIKIQEDNQKLKSIFDTLDE